MQSEFIAVAPFWTVGHTIDYMREARDLPDSFYQIYVVDPTFKLLGCRSPRPHLADQTGGKSHLDHGRTVPPGAGDG